MSCLKTKSRRRRKIHLSSLHPCLVLGLYNNIAPGIKQKKTIFDNAGIQLKHRRVHGGRIAKGHRKLERPLSPKKPLHLVLKSSRAVGP